MNKNVLYKLASLFLLLSVLLAACGPINVPVKTATASVTVTLTPKDPALEEHVINLVKIAETNKYDEVCQNVAGTGLRLQMVYLNEDGHPAVLKAGKVWFVDVDESNSGVFKVSMDKNEYQVDKLIIDKTKNPSTFFVDYEGKPVMLMKIYPGNKNEPINVICPEVWQPWAEYSGGHKVTEDMVVKGLNDWLDWAQETPGNYKIKNLVQDPKGERLDFTIDMGKDFCLGDQSQFADYDAIKSALIKMYPADLFQLDISNCSDTLEASNLFISVQLLP